MLMNEKFPWFRNLVADNIYLDILHSNIDQLKYCIRTNIIWRVITCLNRWKHYNTFEIVTDIVLPCIEWWSVRKFSIWIQTWIGQYGPNSKWINKSLKTFITWWHKSGTIISSTKAFNPHLPLFEFQKMWFLMIFCPFKRKGMRIKVPLRMT